MKYIYFSLIYILLHSCIDTYDVVQSNDSKYLVVQALITNETGPFKARLSRTVGLKESNVEIAETGAFVYIEGSDGSNYILDEVSNGNYESNQKNLKATKNIDYILKITTTNGKHYESIPVQMKVSPKIERVYTKRNDSFSKELGKSTKGFDIVLDTYQSTKSEGDFYYKWAVYETYRRKTPYKTKNQLSYWPEYVHYPYNQCWNTDTSKAIIIERSGTYLNGKINNQLLKHIQEKDNRFSSGYSVLVKQFSLNFNTFQFWKMVEENTEKNGNIYDNIPYNSTTNITCCDSDEDVIGYFDVSFVSSMRLNLISPIEEIEFPNFYDHCKHHYATRDDYYNDTTELWQGPFFIIEFFKDEFTYTRESMCVTCDHYCDTHEKPSYWIYE